MRGEETFKKPRARQFRIVRKAFSRKIFVLMKEMARAVADNGFEAKLRGDLPRGLKTVRERGMLARWLTPEEMTGEVWQYKQGGLMLGRRAGREIGWNDNRHMLTIAGSRAGKGVSLIVPNLIMYEGSAFVIDPKGENAAITQAAAGKARRRAAPVSGRTSMSSIRSG